MSNKHVHIDLGSGLTHNSVTSSNGTISNPHINYDAADIPSAVGYVYMDNTSISNWSVFNPTNNMNPYWYGSDDKSIISSVRSNLQWYYRHILGHNKCWAESYNTSRYRCIYHMIKDINGSNSINKNIDISYRKSRRLEVLL